VWELKQTNNQSVPPRTQHSPTTTGNALWIFGGGQQASVPVDDTQLHRLCFDTWKWTEPEVKGKVPERRQGHTLTAYGSKLILHGGLQSNNIFDDLWVFDTESNTWSEIEPKGTKPCARAAHTASVVGNHLFTSGGLAFRKNDPGPHPSDEIFALNLDTMTWITPKLCSAPMNGRFGHTMCAINFYSKPKATSSNPSSSEHASTKEQSFTKPKAAQGPVITDVTSMLMQNDANMDKLTKLNLGDKHTVIEDDLAMMFVYGGMDARVGTFFDDSMILRIKL